FSPPNGHYGRVQSLVISVGYGANSLLGGSTEFRRRSTNLGGPINRITIEFGRDLKTAKCGRGPSLDPCRRTPASTAEVNLERQGRPRRQSGPSRPSPGGAA